MRVHHRQFLDEWITSAFDPLPGARDHRLGDVDADNLCRRIVVLERQPGADADFEDAPTDVSCGRGSGAPTVQENRTAQRVINRCPPRIGLLHHVAIRIAQHRSPESMDRSGRPDINRLLQNGDTRLSPA